MAFNKGNDELTLKQKKFVKEYLSNGYNGTQAALKAGYSASCAKVIASQTLTKYNVKKYMSKSMKEIEEKLGITVEWKANMLKRCAERCLPEDENKDMHPTAMISAISELNKMQGHYASSKIELSEGKREEEMIEKVREIANEQRKEF